METPEFRKRRIVMDIMLISTTFNSEVHGTNNGKKTGCGINLLKAGNDTKYRQSGRMTDLKEITCERCKERLAREMIRSDKKEMNKLLKEEKQRIKAGIEDEGIIPLGNTTAKITKAPEPAPAPAPVPEPTVPEKPSAPVRTIPGTGVAMDDDLAQFAISPPKPEPEKDETATEVEDFLAQFAIKKPEPEPEEEKKSTDDDFLAQFSITPPSAQAEEEKEPEEPVVEDIMSMFAIDKDEVPEEPQSVEYSSDSTPDSTEGSTEEANAWDLFANQFFGMRDEEETAPAEEVPAQEDDMPTLESMAAFAKSISDKPSALDGIAPPVLDDIAPSPEPVREEVKKTVLDDIAPPVLDDIAPPPAPVQEEVKKAVLDDIAPPVLDDIAPPPAPVREEVKKTVLDDIAPPVLDDIAPPPAPVNEEVKPPVLDDIAPPVLDDIAPSPAPVNEEVKPPVPDDIAPPVLDDIAPSLAPVPVESAEPEIDFSDDSVVNTAETAMPENSPAPATEMPSANFMDGQPFPQSVPPVQGVPPISPMPMPVQMPQGMSVQPQIMTVPQLAGYDANGQPVYTYMQMQLTGYDANGQPVLVPFGGQPAMGVPMGMGMNMAMGVGMPQQFGVPVPPTARPETAKSSEPSAAMKSKYGKHGLTPGQRIAAEMAAKAASGETTDANVSKISVNPHSKSTSSAFISAISESKDHANESLTDTQGLKAKTPVITSVEDMLAQLGDSSEKDKKMKREAMQKNAPKVDEYRAPVRNKRPSEASIPASTQRVTLEEMRPLTKAEQKAKKKQDKIAADFKKKMEKMNK